MATYDEIYDLAADAANNGLLKATTTAVRVAANAHLQSGSTADERAWASAVLYKAESEARKALHLMLVTSMHLTPEQILAAAEDDTVVQAKVNSVVDELIKAMARV